MQSVARVAERFHPLEFFGCEIKALLLGQVGLGLRSNGCQRAAHLLQSGGILGAQIFSLAARRVELPFYRRDGTGSLNQTDESRR